MTVYGRRRCVTDKLYEEIPKKLGAEEKKRLLFNEQKKLLDTFLEHRAISREQYDKSLGDMALKMGIAPDVK